MALRGRYDVAPRSLHHHVMEPLGPPSQRKGKFYEAYSGYFQNRMHVAENVGETLHQLTD